MDYGFLCLVQISFDFHLASEVESLYCSVCDYCRTSEHGCEMTSMLAQIVSEVEGHVIPVISRLSNDTGQYR